MTQAIQAEASSNPTLREALRALPSGSVLLVSQDDLLSVASSTDMEVLTERAAHIVVLPGLVLDLRDRLDLLLWQLLLKYGARR